MRFTTACPVGINEYLALNNETIRVSVKDYLEGGEKRDDKKKKLDKKYVQFQGVKGYTSQSTESCVHFEIEFDPIVLQSLMKKVSKQKTSLSNDIDFFGHFWVLSSLFAFFF